jgi:hypothetical protein
MPLWDDKRDLCFDLFDLGIADGQYKEIKKKIKGEGVKKILFSTF